MSNAMSFWAGKAAEFKALADELGSLLPPVNDGEHAVTAETKEDALEAFRQAQLAAETILGGYTRASLAGTRSATTQPQPQQQSPTNGQHYSRW